MSNRPAAPASASPSAPGADLEAAVEAAWEEREALSLATTGPAREAVEATLDALDAGALRVAEPPRRRAAPGASTSGPRRRCFCRSG